MFILYKGVLNNYSKKLDQIVVAIWLTIIMWVEKK